MRLHVDSRSDALNAGLRSRAFTVGSDVFVRRSDYRPGSGEGDAVLAHELAHTVQPGRSGGLDVVRRLVIYTDKVSEIEDIIAADLAFQRVMAQAGWDQPGQVITLLDLA